MWASFSTYPCHWYPLHGRLASSSTGIEQRLTPIALLLNLSRQLSALLHTYYLIRAGKKYE